MSYSYRDEDREIYIHQHGDDAYVKISKNDVHYFAIDVPHAERQAAAQALAGDGYAVLSREKFDALVEGMPAVPSDPIDPADVKVGDVVKVEANDGSWLMRGEVTATNHNTPYPTTMPLTLAGPRGWMPSLRNATVRLVRRAEPEVDPERVEALAELVGIAAGATTTEVRPNKWQQMARELIRRGVTVRKEH